MQRIAHRNGAVVDRRHDDGTGHLRLQIGQGGANGVHYFDGVGAGLTLYRNRDRILAIEGSPSAHVFYAVFHLGHITQAHRITAFVADDQVGEFTRGAQLLVALQDQGLRWAVQRADRCIDVGCAQSGTHFVQTNIHACQRFGLDAHPHRKALGAVDIDLGHTIDGGHGG